MNWVLQFFRRSYERDNQRGILIGLVSAGLCLLAAFAAVSQVKVREIYSAQGQVIDGQIRFAIQPGWENRIDTGAKVILVDRRDSPGLTGLLSHTELEKSGEGTFLYGYAPVDETYGWPSSTLLDLKVMAGPVSLYDLFLTTFGMN